MPRYIDADKKVHIQVYNDEHEEYIVLEQTIAECLDSYTDEGCPEPADVQEVKHAHWEGLASGYGFVCSNCGAREKRSAVFNRTHKFCYKCGAKMDGKEEE